MRIYDDDNMCVLVSARPVRLHRGFRKFNVLHIRLP